MKRAKIYQVQYREESWQCWKVFKDCKTFASAKKELAQHYKWDGLVTRIVRCEVIK